MIEAVPPLALATGNVKAAAMALGYVLDDRQAKDNCDRIRVADGDAYVLANGMPSQQHLSGAVGKTDLALRDNQRGSPEMFKQLQTVDGHGGLLGWLRPFRKPCFGAADLWPALAHGATGVVIAGGLGLRMRDALTSSGFAEGFCDKGRYEGIVARIPVKLLTHPQPGLYGAAAAFAAEHGA